MPKKSKKPLPPTIATKSLFGGFGDLGYISTDPEPTRTDPYIKMEPIPSRYLGSNFKVGHSSSGKTPDAYLDKTYLTLASATQNKSGPDPYVDPGKADLRAMKEAKKLNIDQNKDFKYPSVPPKPVGAGSDFGCFGKHLEHKPDYKVVERGSSVNPEARPKPQPKNILTRPGKRGTYGFPGLTIGTPFEPPKVSDEFDAMRKREREAWEASKKKRIGTGVFRTAIPPKQTFDEKPTGVSKVYDFFDVKPPKEKKEKKEKPPKEGEEKKEAKPWKTAGACKPFLNSFPNTRDDKPDPYDTLRLKRKEEKEKGPKPLAGTWKPVSGGKSSVIRSLLKRFY